MYNISHNIPRSEYSHSSIRELFIKMQIVDDVMTTGATINECGKVLLESCANRIYAASVALAE